MGVRIKFLQISSLGKMHNLEELMRKQILNI